MQVMPVLTQNTTPFTTNGFTIGKVYDVVCSAHDIHTVLDDNKSHDIHTVLDDNKNIRYVSLDCPSPHIKGILGKQREACIGMFVEVVDDAKPWQPTYTPQPFVYKTVWPVPQPDIDTTLWDKVWWHNWSLEHRPEDYHGAFDDKYDWKRYQDKKRQESYDKVVQERVKLLREITRVWQRWPEK